MRYVLGIPAYWVRADGQLMCGDVIAPNCLASTSSSTRPTSRLSKPRLNRMEIGDHAQHHW